MAKQTKINNVDVSKCIYLRNANTKMPYCSEHEGKRTTNYVCEHYPNCYYKQLARKTQECKRLKIEKRALVSNRLNMFEHLDIVQENKKYKDALKQIKNLVLEIGIKDE